MNSKKKIFPLNLGNYIKWDVADQGKIIKSLYDWKTDELEGVPNELNPFGSKIECYMGTRDYIKFLKRGYSRISQNSAELIRKGLLKTEQAKKISDLHEGEIPSLDIFLSFIKMEKEEFYNICESMEVFPHKRDKTKNNRIAEKTEDFSDWYSEK